MYLNSCMFKHNSTRERREWITRPLNDVYFKRVTLFGSLYLILKSKLGIAGPKSRLL